MFLPEGHDAPVVLKDSPAGEDDRRVGEGALAPRLQKLNGLLSSVVTMIQRISYLEAPDHPVRIYWVIIEKVLAEGEGGHEGAPMLQSANMYNI